MAGRSLTSKAEPTAGAVDRAEKAGGQDTSSQKIEDLMEMVQKLQKVGSLEPRVEVLINRINEVQQAKKKANKDLGEARTICEALQKELDSHTLRILRLHCQEKESEAHRKHTMLQECKERISALNLQIEEEKNKQRQLRLAFEEQLEDLMGQHKDLWDFHMPERLAREICALDSSKEQLLMEEKLVKATLEDVKHQLCSLCGAEGPSTLDEGLFLRSQEAAATVQLFQEEHRKAEELLAAAAQRHQQLQQKCQQQQQKRQRLKEELEKHGMQVPAQAQSTQEEEAGPGDVASPKPLKGERPGAAHQAGPDVLIGQEDTLHPDLSPRGFQEIKELF
ncbi:synaptonemal complex central element protein 1 isoform X4 [Gorilla gorilla gorilla]|uniref:synaptonemal complex central element protein 1 isoform X4 n=1 Tax=Gorilla gorilla gorilla TaxID=9595 RepID=UPI0024458C34|nr:synaptonemal complex central element protein 1 isoform X4 [Gorilla gorilla gorilla]